MPDTEESKPQGEEKTKAKPKAEVSAVEPKRFVIRHEGTFQGSKVGLYGDCRRD